MSKVQFNLLSDDAVMPTKGTAFSAGYDLYAARDCTVVGGEGIVIVPTDVSVVIPEGYYGRIAMRSGLAVKQHLAVSAGVIDRDYTAGLGIVTYCVKTGHSYSVKKHERVAQLIIEKAYYEETEERLEESTHCGFGSTGSF